MSRPPIIDVNNTPGMVGIGSLPGSSPVASFNIDGIKNLLTTKSFVAYHLRSAPNPDRENIGAPVNPNTQAANRGRIYYGARPVGIIPQQFKLEDRLVAQGIWGKGSVLFNVTGEYLDDNPENRIVHIRNGDIIAINETFTAPVEQLFDYNPTGPQRLNYKIKGVDVLFDDKNTYQEGRDFNIVNYEIVWTNNGLKPDKIGKVLSCVYYHTPIFVVQSLPHWLRIIPSNETGHGANPREAVYAPQQIVAIQSTIMEENNLMDWYDLPPFPDYPNSGNLTGGSR